MTDYISRQAAIEAVGYYSLSSGDKLLFADKPLKELPSAQQWIPCNERLPIENTIVLATTADFMYIVEFEIYSNGHICWNEVNEYRSVADVIAWMPLPEPYKEGEA